MNTLLNGMKSASNWAMTENGGITHKTTNSDLLDMFAMGAAMRNRSDEDVILMFQKAFAENAELAMKMLFYIRDVRGGQGERRFFRTVMSWAATRKDTRESVRKNIQYFSEFGRWDDLYCLVGTPLEKDALSLMKEQLALDVQCKTPSLLAKWLKSENASSGETHRLADITRRYLGMTHREYRKTLSILRARINVLEVLMSANRWDEIEFDKIPSKAGLIYKNAFARRDIIKAKYEGRNPIALDNVDRLMINKYWDNLTDFFKGAKLNALCMVDTSGSMSGTPINVATALGLYCAERAGGPFAGHYISFSSRPQLIATEGVDFCDKVDRIVRTNLCENTNIEAAFDMVLNTALTNRVPQSDMPEYILVISDMEFDSATGNYWRRSGSSMCKANAESVMETIERKWNERGYQLPRLIYWNVDARQANIPMIGNHYVSYVSGFSPSIFKSIVTGKTGWDLMIEAICAERYECIHA